jgi:hypothetical protein
MSRTTTQVVSPSNARKKKTRLKAKLTVSTLDFKIYSSIFFFDREN